MKTEVNLRNEELLLCGLCRLTFDAENGSGLRSLAEKISDWSYFYELAGRHGIAALVYNNLASLDLLQFVPFNIKEILRNSLLNNIARNAGFTEKISEVLGLLEKENIRVVLLKGLALELSVYGNCGLRQMTDVDVLVSRDNALQARKILMENGFRSHPLKSVLYKPIFLDAGKHLPTLTRHGFSVEIHHELFSLKNSVLTKMLYDGSTEIEIKGNRAYIPSPGMFFLYLVKHLWLHEMNNESQLRLYTDLAVLLDKYMDLIIEPALVDLAGKAGMNEILSSYLRLLRDFWGISFPKWMNDFIDKWSGNSSIDRFVFFLKSPKDNPQSDRAMVYRYHLGEIPGFHRKLLFVAGDLFPTPEFMKNRYGCKSMLKAFIYYPLRWGKLWYLFKRGHKGTEAQGHNGSSI